MLRLAQLRLPSGISGPILSGVAPLKRALALFVAGPVLVGLTAGPAWAQATPDGWFDESAPAKAAAPAATPAAPAAPRTGTPGVPATPASPGVPAAPAAPAGPGEPLADSPLLENNVQPPQATEEDRDPRALTAWNAYVDPYGTWRDDPRYGRVWVPSPGVVGADFAPYSTGGHWSLDDNNQWTWVSDYPFGWVTFHYGRWVWIGGAGWAWVPGLTYAPAWVAWRTPVGSYSYVGWAPLPPAYVWFGGYATWYPYYPVYPWVFCPSEYVFYPHVHAYIVHDHYGMAYAARYTRPYYPATPTPGGHAGAAPRGPSPQSAHVPARAVPMERVSSRAIEARGATISSAHNMGRQAVPGDARRQMVQQGAVRSLSQSPLVRSSSLESRRFSSARPGNAPLTSRSATLPRFPTASAPRGDFRAGSSSVFRSVPSRSVAPRFDRATPSAAPMRSAPHGFGGGHSGTFSRPSGGIPRAGGGAFHGGGGHGRR